jgi:uncharacterized membrane protein
MAHLTGDRRRRLGPAATATAAVITVAAGVAITALPAAGATGPPTAELVRAAADTQATAGGFTMGGQGYLLDDGQFRRIAVPGATGTLPYGIDNRGQVVGIYDDPRGRSHGFAWERGSFRTIDVPVPTGTTPDGISGSGALDINNRGQIVGAYVGTDGHEHGYLRERGQFQIIDAPGSTDTIAFSINDRGQITVQSSSPDEPDRSFLLDHGHFTRIQFPAAADTLVHKNNNDGEIVGVYSDGSLQQHGFTLSNGRYRTVDYPGTTVTGVNASNTRGQIVGYLFEGDPADPANLAIHGAILTRGRLTTFDAPGPPSGHTGTTVYDINDRGQMVGAKLPLPDTTTAAAPAGLGRHVGWRWQEALAGGHALAWTPAPGG